MNSERYEEVSLTAAAELFAGNKKKAKEAIADELAKMVEKCEAYKLSKEEERMLQEFRRFKGRCRAGDVFKWQTRPSEELIVTENIGLIEDPQTVR